MAIFLSSNNTKPYAVLQDLRMSNSIEVSFSSGATVIEHEEAIYLIATDSSYTNIELRVENENSSGASLYISSVDGIGNPTHWGKLITIPVIDATTTDVKVLFKYKWAVINNIYILKRTNVSGNINIYEA